MWSAKYFPSAFSFILFISSISFQAEGVPQEWGTVNMRGTVVDAACSIALENREQTIDMGIVPVSDIVREGQGLQKTFSIRLVNCILEHSDNHRRQFLMTFDGDRDGVFFRLRGEASGVALQIADETGRIALPGNPLLHNNINSNNNAQLKYHIRLVANNQTLKAGNHSSAIRFKLDYF